MRRLWLRWSYRDLRLRWAQILATALTLAVGVGGFAGLRSLEQWRTDSAEQSFAALNAADLRIDLAAGEYVPRGDLDQAVAELTPRLLAASQERLVVDSQLESDQGADTVVVPAQLVGAPGRLEEEPVDAVAVTSPPGGLADAGRGATVLDWNFADFYDLPDRGEVRIAGLGRVSYEGLGVSPRYFLIVDELGVTGAQGNIATVYLPIDAAEEAAGLTNQVNELLVRVPPGADMDAAEAAIERRLRQALPDRSARISRASEEPGTEQIFRDAENDQKTYTVFAILILAGAALAAFNLVSRAVEAQRREIGIGMALGAEPRALARRPLLLGVQIGVIGAALGVPIGLGLAALIQGFLRDALPLPVYASGFPLGLYAQGALLGLVIPVLAAALPVRRALRVRPVEAIDAGYRSVAGPGLARLLRGMRLPGGAITELPVRNVGRKPRRTAMTVIGLGAVISAVVAVLGMVDTIGSAADRARAAAAGATPDRVEVNLGEPSPAGGELVRGVEETPGARRSEPGLALAATASTEEGDVGLVLGFVDPDSSIWRPELASGRFTPRGIVLAEKAAEDLGVGLGDTVAITYPRPDGGGEETAEAVLGGIAAGPIRALGYMDVARQRQLGLGDLVNQVTLVPAPGVSASALQQRLFGKQGVASVRPALAAAEALERTVDSFSAAIQIVVVVTLVLGLLVAFTSASASVEERRREYATLFAIGLPVPRGFSLAVAESLVVGAVGTLIGLAVGFGVASWIVTALLAETMPDLGFELTLTASSVAMIVAIGVGAVALAPLLTGRRLRRMDIPSTLRVME